MTLRTHDSASTIERGGEVACPLCLSCYALEPVGGMCGDLSHGQSAPCPGILVPADDVRRWQELDWAMRALSLAMHECSRAGLDDIVTELTHLHELVRGVRDGA